MDINEYGNEVKGMNSYIHIFFLLGNHHDLKYCIHGVDKWGINDSNGDALRLTSTWLPPTIHPHPQGILPNGQSHAANETSWVRECQ